jgi:hypothetical protein
LGLQFHIERSHRSLFGGVQDKERKAWREMDEEILDGESKYGCRSGLRELDGEIDG